MTPAIATLLAIVAAAAILLALDWFSGDTIALGVLLSLVFTGLLTPAQAFSGFGSETVMLLLGLLILTAALLRTGVVDVVGRAILRRTGDDPKRLVVVILISSAALSAFISNTAATAFFLPVTIGLAARSRTSPSRLLLPLAFGSILSSSVTLVSTSTNIVVSGVMTRYGMAPMGMFELAPVGVPIVVVGLLYMLTIGRRLIPERRAPGDLTQQFGLRDYVTEVLVLPGSSLAGKTLAESGFARDFDLNVVMLVRGGQHLVPWSQRIEGGDVLLVEGRSEDILKVKDTAGIDIRPDVKFADPDLEGDQLKLAEVILTPRSPLIGRTLKSYGFRERFGLQVLALNRHGETLRRKIGDVVLRLGDVLLVQGSGERIGFLGSGLTFRVLGAIAHDRPNRRHAPLATAIFAAVLGAATVDLIALPVAALLGALLVFVTGCITPDEAYREVEWKAIVLIGGMLALGVAMEETGAAGYLAAQLVAAGPRDPLWLLSAFFALTLALTQPMSNQAAAIVVLPVAIQTALQLGLDPRPFAMMVALAASCSYLTPLEPSCVMVYGPGRYRFFDFVRVGAPLTLLIYLISILLVPEIWPVR